MYLGKSLTVNGEDPAQVLEFIVKFKSNVDKICACNLPITLTLLVPGGGGGGRIPPGGHGEFIVITFVWQNI